MRQRWCTERFGLTEAEKLPCIPNVEEQRLTCRRKASQEGDLKSSSLAEICYIYKRELCKDNSINRSIDSSEAESQAFVSNARPQQKGGFGNNLMQKDRKKEKNLCKMSLWDSQSLNRNPVGKSSEDLRSDSGLGQSVNSTDKAAEGGTGQRIQQQHLLSARAAGWQTLGWWG